MDASGRVVIEELDTPLTRRQKSMKKKAEKKKSAATGEGSISSVRIIEHGKVESGDGEMSSPAPPISVAGGPTTSTASAPSSSAVPGPSSSHAPRESHLQGDDNEDAGSESELSELSELTSEVASSQRDVVQDEEPAPKKTPVQAKRVRGKRRVTELYDSGTLGKLIFSLSRLRL